MDNPWVIHGKGSVAKDGSNVHIVEARLLNSNIHGTSIAARQEMHWGVVKPDPARSVEKLNV
jgi:hypothetical protein